jgi:hypothetical protein
VAGVYEWNADADGKGKAGWKQTVLDVIATYTLVEDKEDTTANDPAKSGISIASALQDTATDVVTIKLAGTFKGEYVAVVDAEHSGTFGANWFKDMWGPADASNWANASQEPGVYGTVAITGLFPKALTTHAVEIKPYPALGYYIGVQETKTVLTSPAGPNEDRHYIPTDLTARQKWTYSTSKVKDEILDVILYNGGTTAAEKSVTVDIVNYTYDAEAADGAKYVRGAGILKVTIDYSDVAFPKVAVPADPQ